jgi:uncharacterized protein (TIGR02391 family)
MAGRGSQGPPPIQSKVFTREEIELGIRKLTRRLDELKAIDPRTTQCDDPRVEAATRDIKADILEIFGQHSPEYLNHGSFSVGYPRGVSWEDSKNQRNFAQDLPKAIGTVEGLIKRLEEKREDLAAVDTTGRVRASFEGLDLHPRIASVAAELYRDGHYRHAVLDASVSLVNYVKEKSRRHDLDGAKLMSTVFSKNNPILAFNDLKDQTDEDEQEGMMHLFMGVVLALRNPRAHALLDDSPELALEYIGLISLLAKRVDEARRRAVGQP